MTPDSTLIDVRRLAQILRLTPAAVCDWHRRGKLPPPLAAFLPRLRWTPDQIDSWLRAQEVAAGPPTTS